MKPLSKVNRNSGIDVLTDWLFSLPELSYVASIDSIEAQDVSSDIQSKVELARCKLILNLDPKKFTNQELRNAQATISISEQMGAELAEIRRLNLEAEKTKAAKKYYDDEFRAVKDEVYYLHRNKELIDQKELLRMKAKALGDSSDNRD